MKRFELQTTLLSFDDVPWSGDGDSFNDADNARLEIESLKTTAKLDRVDVDFCIIDRVLGEVIFRDSFRENK